MTRWVEVDVDFVHMTDGSILIDPTGNDDEDEFIWLPRRFVSEDSQAELEDCERHESVTLELAAWLATKEGLI